MTSFTSAFAPDLLGDEAKSAGMANGLTADGQAHLSAGLALDPSFSPLVVEAARAQVAP